MSVVDENVAISTLNKKDLIAGAIRKHKRFLEEYTAEFRELDDNVKSLGDQIEAAKDNREHIVLRTDVLKEKRQQLYHQAAHMSEEVFALVSAGTDDQKQVRSIQDGLAKLRTSIALEEEKQIVSDIINDLTFLAANIPQAQESVLQMRSRIEEALGSTVELSSIDGTDDRYDGEYTTLNARLKKISPRHRSLENKIKSHQEALAHWENIETGNVADEPEVMSS